MHPEHTSFAKQKLETRNHRVLSEVKEAIASNDVVVVGMAWNPHVKRARKTLDAAGVRYTYLGFGNYPNNWQQRLSIKMWSQWPTFPQVFKGGKLIGGADETEQAIEAGVLS